MLGLGCQKVPLKTVSGIIRKKPSRTRFRRMDFLIIPVKLCDGTQSAAIRIHAQYGLFGASLPRNCCLWKRNTKKISCFCTGPLRGLYAHYTGAKACLEAETFPLRPPFPDFRNRRSSLRDKNAILFSRMQCVSLLHNKFPEPFPHNQGKRIRLPDVPKAVLPDRPDRKRHSVRIPCCRKRRRK